VKYSSARPAITLLPVRRIVPSSATALLLAGPAALAFFAGGYFDQPRLVAAAVAWAVVLVLAVAGPLPIPASTPGRVAVAGLAGITVWSAISLAWAPLGAPAADNVQRLLLYLGALLAAVALLRDRRARAAVEPVLTLGAVVVTAYGLSGRLLPGVIELSRSQKAEGRLEQPISYWNAEGLLAAIGFVLCVRIAGDRSRPAAMRVVASAACAPLGAGVYLSYSRSAIAAAVVGVMVLLALAPSRAQLRSALTGLLAAVAAAVASASFAGVAALDGSHSDQVRDGAIVLGLLAAIVLVVALVSGRIVAGERRGRVPLGTLPQARRLPAIAGAVAVVCVVGLVVAELEEPADRSAGATGQLSKISTVTSHRDEFWRVGLIAFERDPLLGAGSGGFRVVWRQERDVPVGALEVHSLVLEMAAELGAPGLLALALFLGGAAAAGSTAVRRGGSLAPGACAASVVWLLPATVDWHWQLPAVTLPFLVLVGGLIAEGEAPWRAPAFDAGPAEADDEPDELAGEPLSVPT
jgi:O-antigen ligase